MLLMTLLFLAPIFIVFLKYLLFGGAKLPPGPNVWQVLRNLSKLGKNPHVEFLNLAKIYGPLMSLRLGGQFVVVASSSEIAKEILQIHDRNFSGRYLPSVYYKVPQAIHSSLIMSRECNDSWKFLRGMAQNFIFSSKCVELKAELRKAKVLEMVDYLRSKGGEIVKVDDVINATITNILSNMLVSRDLLDIRGKVEKDEKVKEIVCEIIEKISGLGLADLFPILRGIDFWSNGKGMDIYRRVMYIWEDIVKERRKRGKEEIEAIGDFLDVLVENKLYDDQICLLLMEILVAGTDTSTITSIWLMVELVRHQDMLHKLRHDVAKAFNGDELADESILSECQYLQACIKETLRFHMPGPFLVPHRAIEACKVDNYLIPKDTTVLVNAWAIARDPENWNVDATNFKPERFLDSNIGYKGSHFEFIPFSAGRRMCPGSSVAFRNFQIIVASLVHYFDWSLPYEENPSTIDVDDEFVTVLKKKSPLFLVPKSRISNM